MGIPVLILGESGSGKSTSLRNFEQGEIGIFNVASKPLPFRKQLQSVDGADYALINKTLRKNSLKRYVIDDSQYLMAYEAFRRAKDTGYQKFTEFALDFKNLIDTIVTGTSADTIVYLLHHVETTEGGRVKAKTIGKMLDNQITLEGMFSIVLMTQIKDRKYSFITQSDGYTSCKSPIDMFELEIDNDLKIVDQKIREYWGIKQ